MCPTCNDLKHEKTIRMEKALATQNLREWNRLTFQHLPCTCGHDETEHEVKRGVGGGARLWCLHPGCLCMAFDCGHGERR